MSIILSFLEALLARIVLGIVSDLNKKKSVSEDSEKEVEGLMFEVSHADSKEKRINALKRLHAFISE